MPPAFCKGTQFKRNAISNWRCGSVGRATAPGMISSAAWTGSGGSRGKGKAGGARSSLATQWVWSQSGPYEVLSWGGGVGVGAGKQGTEKIGSQSWQKLLRKYWRTCLSCFETGACPDSSLLSTRITGSYHYTWSEMQNLTVVAFTQDVLSQSILLCFLHEDQGA